MHQDQQQVSPHAPAQCAAVERKDLACMMAVDEEALDGSRRSPGPDRRIYLAASMIVGKIASRLRSCPSEERRHFARNAPSETSWTSAKRCLPEGVRGIVV